MSYVDKDALKSFPYELGRKVEVKYDSMGSIWSLFHGKRKSSDEVVSIFVFEASKFESEDVFNIAKYVVKRIKALRHPGILRYLDSLETDDLIYLVVEPVEPLGLYLYKVEKKSNEQKWFAVSWGLYQIASAVTFLNEDCQLTHYSVCKSSVFVDRAGEWKLFGLECIKPSKDTLPYDVFLTLARYYVIKFNFGESTSIKISTWVYDSWGLGHLIWQLFNGECPAISKLQIPGNIPKKLVNDYLQLVHVDQKSRLFPSAFLKRTSEGTGFFKNKFVDTMLFLKEINIKEKEEKCKFLNNLTSHLDTFPQETCLYRILPELFNILKFGFVHSPVLSPTLKVPVMKDEITIPSLSTNKQNDACDRHLSWDNDWQNLEFASKCAKNTQKLKSYFPKKNDPLSLFQDKNVLKEEKERESESKSVIEVNGWNTSDDRKLWDTADSNKGHILKVFTKNIRESSSHLKLLQSTMTNGESLLSYSARSDKLRMRLVKPEAVGTSF